METGSTSSDAWIQAVDSFYEKANLMISNHNLNVEFILDQSGTPGGLGLQNRNCLAHKWPLWVSTYISYRDPPEAFLNNYDMYIASLSLGNHFGRFQILNEAAPMPTRGIPVTYYIENAAKQNYGKFLHGNYPILVWEPSNQIEIQKVIEVFRNYSVHNQHGFRFSINNDVPQFQIFGNLTNRAWNLRLPQLEQHFNPHLITLPTINGTTLLVFAYGQEGTVCHTFFTSKVLSSHLEIRQKYLLPEIFTAIKSVNTHRIGDDQLLVIQDNFGSFFFYQYDGQSIKYLYLMEGSGSQKALQSSLVHQDKKLYLAHLVSSASCNLELQLFHIQVKLPKIGFTLKSKLCLGSFKMKDYSIVDASLVVFDDGLHPSQLRGLVYYTAVNRDFYASFGSSIELKVSKEGTFSLMSPIGSSLEESFVWIGSAESIHVSSAKYKDTHVISLVNDRGYCWFSFLNNLKASPLLCDNFPDSTPTILNYSYGTLEQWIEFLSNHRKLEFGADVFIHNFLTPCSSLQDDNVLFHGVYDRGYSPRGSLMLTSDTAAILTVHRGLDPETASIDYAYCGEALPFDGIVLDAWKLPSTFQVAPEPSGAENSNVWEGMLLWPWIVVGLIVALWWNRTSAAKTINHSD